MRTYTNTGNCKLTILILGNILNTYKKLHLPPILYENVISLCRDNELFSKTVKLKDKTLTIEKSEEKNFLKLLDTYYKILSSEDTEGEHIQYDIISSLIYQLDPRDLEKDGDIEVYLYTEDNSICLFKEKMEKHIRLALLQYRQITDASKKAENLANESLKTMKEVESIKGTLYSEVIAIIGIFSALIFGLFGGFEGIKGVLSLFEKDDKFGIISMYCGLVTLMIVTITFALIQFVGRLIGRNLKSCCYKTDCKCKPQDKYNIYTICVYISIGMIILGAIFNGNKRLMDIIFWITMIGILLTLIPTILKALSFLLNKISSIIK